MLNIKAIIAVGLLLVTTSLFAQENSILLTKAGESQYEIDLFTESKSLSAFDFEVSVGKAFKDASISNCVSGLPSTHFGDCRINNGVLKVFVFSPTNASLSTTNIGSIQVENATLIDDSGHAFASNGQALDVSLLSDGISKKVPGATVGFKE